MLNKLLNKRIVAVISAMLIMTGAFGLGVFAESQQDKNYGYNDDVKVNVTVSETKGESPSKESFEAKYDSRDQKELFPSYVQERDQNPYGTCWAFSTTNAADISYAWEQKSKNNVERTSPGHLAYFFYNRQGDPLGLTTNDKNVNTSQSNWRSVGGNHVFTFQSMANRDGLALESVFPYSNTSSLDPYSTSDYNKLKYVTEDAEMAEYSSYTNKDNYYNDVKSMVKKYGAVAVSIYMTTSYDYYSSQYKALCYKGEETSTNHAVTIIGWDDNFSKDHFGTKSDAQKDGAWLILNSWGNGSGDKNTFYLSYDDKVGIKNRAVAYNMKPYDSHENLYQYDGTAGCYSETMNAGAQVASMYTAQSDMFLKSVGFTEYNRGDATYDIKVYVGDENSDISTITNTTAAATLTDVHTTQAGYYTFDLSKPVLIKSGQKFCVEVSFKSRTSMGYECSYVNGSWIEFDADIAENQSFYKQNSKSAWKDAKSNNKCYRIKAVSRNAYTVSFDTNLEGVTINSQILEAGEMATKPTDPTYTSNTRVFEGWYTDESYAAEKKFDFNAPVTESVELHAKWSKGTVATIKSIEVVPTEYPQFNNINEFKAAFTDEMPAVFKNDEVKLVDIEKPGEEYKNADGSFTVIIQYSDIFGQDPIDLKKINFSIVHMLSNGSVENIVCEKTENGLVFTTSSFSPFAIGIMHGSLLGDFDYNGLINELDVNTYCTNLVGKNMTDEFKSIADIARDNKYDVNDVITLKYGEPVWVADEK